MKKTVSTFLLVSTLMIAGSAFGEDAPAPRRMPRAPVSRETLVEARDPMPASRQLQGAAAIIDGERLRIGESDLRLFGVVPPQLAASFGPQARAALDALANGQSITCQIRDRDRDGRLLATCRNSNGSDMALELLKRGLAVTARGTIAGTELAAPYLTAEQAAQNQKLGLWSVTTVAPAPVAATPAIVMPKQETVAALPETEIRKEEKVAPRTDKSASAETQQTQAKIAADVLSQQAQTRYDEAAWTPAENGGFFERYQILIAGLLMLTTAMGIMGALWAQKRRDRIDEIKAVAAALRGELMAARAVCIGRIKTIADDAQDRASTWPRIRATLYQAYVGRLGLLGAELARQIASVYGQSSDYAALYNPANATMHNTPKKQALEMLAKHIEEILPRLAVIERTGSLTAPFTARRAAYRPVTNPTASAAAQTENPAVTEEESSPAACIAPLAATVATAPIALWEAVRSFIQSHRNAIVEQHPAEPQEPADPHVAEYAAMIEADMARYQFGENIEPLDLSAKKKSG